MLKHASEHKPLKTDHSTPKEKGYSDQLYHNDFVTNNSAQFCTPVSLSNTGAPANSIFDTVYIISHVEH